MENSCPQRDSIPGPSAYERNAQGVELLELMKINHLKVNTFYVRFLYKLPVQRGRCNNDLSCVFLILNMYRFAVDL